MSSDDSFSHHHYAAGILPYTFVNNEVYVLLGKDINSNTWSDFGGKSEVKDEN